MAQTLGELLVRIGVDPSGLAAGTSKVEAQLQQTGTRLFFLGSRITAGFSAPLGAAVGAVAKFGLEFDHAMSESLAIMDRVTPQIRARMEEQAKSIVDATKFSAAEGAKAYYSLASAGLDAEQSIAALPVVARFAQAAVMDLGKATDFLAGSTAALGLKSANAQENMRGFERVADVLVEVNNRALGTVNDFALALERSGPQLRIFKKDVEEGAAILGVYAEQGIKGARAGQQLYMLLRDLGTAATRHKEAWDAAFGPNSVFDRTGTMRNMADIVDTISKKLAGMSTEAQVTELRVLGLTDRSRLAMLPLIGLGNEIRNLETALRGAGGAAADVAARQMESLRNQLTQIWNLIKVQAINLFVSFRPVIENTILPAMRAIVERFKEFAQWVDTLTEKQKGWLLAITAIGIVLGPAIMFLGTFMLTVRALISPLGVTTGLLRIFSPTVQSTGTNAAVAAGQVGLMTRALSLLASPVTWLLGGLAALTVGMRELTGSWTATFSLLAPPVGGLMHAWQNLREEMNRNKQLINDLSSIARDTVTTSMDVLAKAFRGLKRDAGDLIPGLDQVKEIILALEAARSTSWGEIVARNLRTIAEGTLLALPGMLETKALMEWFENRAKDLAFNLRLKAQAAGDIELPQGGDIELPKGPGDIFLPPTKPTLPFGWDRESPGNALSARIQNLVNRINGTTAFEDAKVWAEAIEKIGGVGKLAVEDLDDALRVFDTAYDRAVKLQGANSNLAQSYGLIWSKLQAIRDLQEGAGAPFGLKAPGNLISELNLFDLAPSMKLDAAARYKMEQVARFGVGRDPFAGVGLRRTSADIRNDMPPPMDWDKLWTVATNSTSRISGEFAKLAQITDGMFSSVARKIGEILSIASIAGKSGIDFQTGLDMFRGTGKFEGSQSKFAGAMEMVTAGLAAFGSFMAATGTKSTTQNVLGGGMVGAQIGGQFGGPIGAGIGFGIGALAALIRGKPEWAKLQSDLARDLGIGISDELAKKMEDTSKEFGRQAATTIHVKDILAEVGGLTTDNFDQYFKIVRDGFAMMAQGQMTVGQQTRVLDDVFKDFAEVGTDAYGRINDQVRELISLSEQYGTKSKAIADWMKGQGANAVSGFNDLVAGSGLAKFVEKGRESVGNEEDPVERDEKLREFGERHVTSLDELKDLGDLAVMNFLAATGAGMTFKEALDAIGPSLGVIRDGFTAMGMEIDNPILKMLSLQQVIAETAPKSLQAAAGLSKSFVSLDNLGLITKKNFEAMERQGFRVYAELEAAAKAHGGTAADALIPLQDWLHQAEDAAKKYGFQLDAGTQFMIDMSKETGVWKDGALSATDRMTLAMDTLIRRIEKLIITMGGVPDVDFYINGHYREDGTPTTGGGETPNAVRPPAGSGTLVPSPFPYEPPTTGLPLSGAQPYASSGGVVTPYGIKKFGQGGLVTEGPWQERGADVVPAMLARNEVVLTEPQQQHITDLIDGLAGEREASTVVYFEPHFHGALVEGASTRRILNELIWNELPAAITRDEAGVRRVIRNVATNG